MLLALNVLDAMVRFAAAVEMRTPLATSAHVSLNSATAWFIAILADLIRSLDIVAFVDGVRAFVVRQVFAQSIEDAAVEFREPGLQRLDAILYDCRDGDDIPLTGECRGFRVYPVGGSSP